MVRNSALPRFIECASSELPTTHPYNPTGEPANVGTATHAACGSMVIGEPYDVQSLCNTYDVRKSVTDVEDLVGYAKKVWAEIKRYFPHPKVEQAVVGPVSRGTADVLHWDRETGVVHDWKSGWIRRSGIYQVMGYASGMRATYGMPKSGKITTIVAWLRYQEYEVWSVRDKDLDDFEAMVKRREDDIGKQYAPGEYCEFCPRKLECDARRDYLRNSVATLTAIEVREVTPDVLASFYPHMKALGKALDDYDKALRMGLEGGAVLPTGNGKAIKLGPGSKHNIDARKAWPVLQKFGFTDDQINNVLKMSKPKIEKIYADRAPDRQMDTYKKKIIQRLRDSGALTTTKFLKLQPVKDRSGA